MLTLVINSMFCVFKAMTEYFLDWDKIEEGPTADIKRKNRRLLLFNYCVQSNYIYLVGWYYLIDMGSIYPTSLELVAYLLIFIN